LPGSMLPAGRGMRVTSSECVEPSKDPDMPRKPLTLVAQLPEFSHLDLGQRRPTGEESRHASVAILPGIAKVLFIEHCEVLGKVLDHLGVARAPAPYGTFACLMPSSPNHFRILADTLRVTCISTSRLPALGAAVPRTACSGSSGVGLNGYSSNCI
jgi:hypothetical protein